MSPLSNIAAIDTGSNAIRVAVASTSAATGLTRLETERIPVRLGRHAFTHGEIDPSTIEAAAAAFARIRTLFDRLHVEHYRAVGTSALRTAHNRDLLLRRIEHESGIEVDIIEGDEEARLVRLAVLETFRHRETPSLLFDLGGGSLEIEARVADGSWVSTTRPIGTVRLMETFGLEGVIAEEEARMIKRNVRALLRGVERDLRGDEALAPGPAVACGGNAEALAQLLGDRDERGTPVLDVDKLRSQLPSILATSIEGRMTRFGMPYDRAEVVAIAAIVLTSIAKSFKLKRLLVPGVGVREGLLIELAQTVTEGQPSGRHAREQSLLAAARNFSTRLNHNTAHAEHVRRLSRMLFDQLAPAYGLHPDLGIVLELAGLLHDVGETVNRQGHQKHSEYLIRWGRIPGLESPLREMVAAIARSHRRSTPDPKKHWSFGELSSERREQVLALTAILRIADGLDTDHRGRVRALSVRPRGNALRLTVHLAESAPETVGLMLRKAGLFEQVFSTTVEADVEVVAGSGRTEMAGVA